MASKRLSATCPAAWLWLTNRSAVNTPRGWTPNGVFSRFRQLRKSKTAPVSRIRERAICAATNMLRDNCCRAPLLCQDDSHSKEGCAKAGAIPNSNPEKSDTPSVNRRILPSNVAVARRGIPSGATRMKRCSNEYPMKIPNTAPLKLSMRLSTNT